jgi:hypothetical protein
MRLYCTHTTVLILLYSYYCTHTTVLLLLYSYHPDPSTSQIITVADALGRRLPSGSMDLVVDTGDAAGIANAVAAAKVGQNVLVIDCTNHRMC